MAQHDGEGSDEESGVAEDFQNHVGYTPLGVKFTDMECQEPRHLTKPIHKPATHSLVVYEVLGRTVQLIYVCGRCASAYRRHALKAKAFRFLVVKGLDLRTNDPAVSEFVYRN